MSDEVVDRLVKRNAELFKSVKDLLDVVDSVTDGFSSLSPFAERTIRRARQQVRTDNRTSKGQAGRSE